MRCIEITEHGGPEVLKEARRSIPEPGDGEVLIKVAAAGINRPDVIQRAGHYPPPPGASDLPGLEVSGVVDRCGANVDWPQEGERVCALVPGGGYAEYCVTPAVQCLPVPEGFDAVQAAGVPETFFTVWFNLFMQTDLASADTVLIHGGSSGIGTTAIQLAKQHDVRVFTTVGSAKKQEFCRRLGADIAINYREEDFVEIVKQNTDGKGVDLVLEMVGSEYLQRDMQALARHGRLVLIGFLEGSKAKFDFMPVMFNNLVVTGSTLRPQPIAVKGRIAAQLREHVWPMFASQRVHPEIYSVFELNQASEAHRLMESSEHMGKIVLEVDRSLF